MFITLLALATSAHAHMPHFGDGWGSPESAFEVDDPQLSIVLYREVTCDQPELWMTFDMAPGDEVWVQLGVPVIDRLVDYRPSMAVLAPGLPEVAPGSVPFDVPEGMGAVIFDTTDATLGSFYEPFTDTDSWILAEDWVVLPEGGPAYAVAWDPELRTGKLWLAMGVVEDFSSVDFSEMGEWMPLVNDFHETGEYSEVPDIEEQSCAVSPPGGDEGGIEVKEKGCATVTVPAGLLGWLLAGLAAAVRRRGRGDDAPVGRRHVPATAIPSRP